MNDVIGVIARAGEYAEDHAGPGRPAHLHVMMVVTDNHDL